MKKIGKEVLFLKTSKTNPRNGESSMIRLADGRVMLAFTEYCGEEFADHGTARISAVCSSDEGESWGEPFLLVSKPEDAQNIMSPSLFRLPDGALGMVYLRKDVRDDFGVTCMPVFVRSEDEGASFCEPVSCGFPEGYYCSVNDSVLVTSGGRIYIPTSYTGECRDVMRRMEKPEPSCVSDIRTAYSDDCGKSWRVLDSVLSSPYSNRRGLYEPGILELDGGELWMYFRTCFGHQYDSVSADGGESWSAVEPNFRFTSPDSPMRVKRANELAAAVFNPCGYSCLNSAAETNKSPKRTPIVLSVSADGGRSFTDRAAVAAGGGLAEFGNHTYLLEDDTSESYCYPSILFVRDGILISYYHSDGEARCLNASKVIKVYYDEIGWEYERA